MVSLFSGSCNGGKGGDIYYLSVCGADRVTRVLLADVVGHGRKVSQISEWVYQQMSSRLDDPDLPGLFSELNDRILTRGFGAMTTAFVLSYYVDLRHLYYCNAGHPPMLARRNEGDWQEVPLRTNEVGGSANLPLGVSIGVRYEMSDTPLVAAMLTAPRRIFVTSERGATGSFDCGATTGRAYTGGPI